MAVFTYTALNGDGKQTTGTVPAESRAAAVAAVIGKGLHPVRVTEAGGKQAVTATPVPGTKPGRVRPKHVENFTRELASLLAGGVPLARALYLLRRETKDPGPQALWGEIHDDVVGGVGLADSLAQHPKTFSGIYIAMVRAGEAGGFLDVVLGQIADFRAREQELKGKVVAALVYPCVLACMAVGVLIFLLTYFIPTFAPIFKDLGAQLPMLTRVIMAVSGVVSSWYVIPIVAALIAGVIIIRRGITTEMGRRQYEKVILGTKGVGSVVAYFAMVRFCRMLGTLLISGVPLIAALKVAKEAIGNQTLADTVAHGIEEVQRGESLARALGEADRLFPASVVEMIAIAEETGRLDKELVRLSVSYEAELDRRLRMLVALAEPLLLFVMASVIGTVVVGMLLPIFQLENMIK